MKSFLFILLVFFVILAVLLTIGVIAGLLLRLIIPDLNLGYGIVAGVTGAGFSAYLVYRILIGPVLIDEVEELPVLDSMEDFPRTLEKRARQPKGRAPRQKNRPPSPRQER